MKKPEVVVVTGASAGVGRAVAIEFAKQGAHLGLLARGPKGLEGAKKDVEQAGGRAVILPTDVADPGQVEKAAAAVEDALGPIDIWVNDAMETVVSPFDEMTPEEFKRVTEVTYLGYVYGTMAALKRMLPRDRGTIVQVGSALSYRAIPLQSAYCGAKHAIRGFTDSLRCELIHNKSNIKLTMVQLPAVNTPQFTWCRFRLPRKPQPVPPIYQPEIPARGIVWAAHHPRRELFVGGSTVAVIWGNKFFPGLGDQYLGKTGYDSQQHDGPPDPNRRDYLWEPVDIDFGAHGEFDQRSKDRSPQLWADMHRSWLVLAAAGAAGVVVSRFLKGNSHK
jgi:NAD(P)-dependent dehydrogenase (short-subunit alcohol dehydrogenase family)